MIDTIWLWIVALLESLVMSQEQQLRKAFFSPLMSLIQQTVIVNQRVIGVIWYTLRNWERSSPARDENQSLSGEF